VEADGARPSDVTRAAVAGRVAVITGATSGLGCATAMVFARAGAAVVAGARRVEEGRALETELRAEGCDLTFVPTDVRRVADCEALIAAAVERHGRIDVLINNAGTEGTPPIQPSHLVTEDEWDDILDTNLKGAFFCASRALEAMSRQRSGVVLNIASINAIEGPARMAAYSASKAGLVQLSRTLAVEYVLDDVRVIAVLVGGVATAQADRTRAAIAEYVTGEPPPPPSTERKANPLVYQPAEVARVLALLCSDDSQVTGATIAVDRAMSAGSMASTMIYMTSAGIWQKPY
jgi:NAD(P)-dependent dehydrogenase (short-subunit alcohol dehydrogenase family)